MNKLKFANKKIVLATISALILLLVLGFSALKFRRDINNTEVIKSYRLAPEAGAEENASLLKALCKDKLGISMHSATSRSHLYLRMTATEESAENLGFSLYGIEENGYIISRQGNGLYLIAKSSKGLTRACWYLTSRLTGKDGSLLLPMDERYVDNGKNLTSAYLYKGTTLSDYQIVWSDKATKEAAYELCYYFVQAGADTPVVTKKQSTSNQSIIIPTKDEASLLHEVQLFAANQLGWIFPGTTEETRGILSSVMQLSIDNMDILEASHQDASAHIAKREAIITLWNTNYSRGIFLNSSTSLKTNIMSFSDEQLYQYVKMLKFCGYNGIQVTDMCSAWAGAGGYEFVHERIRILAEAAHSLDMNFTLWVWGSEFTGYGWCDDTVTYSMEGYNYAYENPDVIKTFDKYYSIYAEMADVCDRIIGHYYDPGNLYTAEDVAYFAKMLRDKCKAVNPNIDFGVNCWVDNFDKQTLVNTLGTDVTLYETGYFTEYDDRAKFRGFCANSGCRLGTWAWNTCEMEIDQLAQMNYNPHIIQQTYQVAMDYDNIMTPGYWSEMDSNHVINVFSLYVAGQLLIDPNQSLETITEQIAEAAVGPEYASEFAQVLNLIEDARSGYDRDMGYLWSSDEYIFKSKNYPAKDILARSEKAMELLQTLINNGQEAYTLPLPISLSDLLRLMEPQIEQIKTFAQFRIGFDEVQSMVKQGSDQEAILAKLQEISVPISEYNTVTGLWGQIEARAQQEILWSFCQKEGYEMPDNPAFTAAQKYRIYEYFVSYQKGHKEPVCQFYPYFQYGVAYGEQRTAELVQELIGEGLFSVDTATNGVYVTDWEHYKYSFN